MTALRIVNVALWGAMMLYMLPGAWAAVRGHAVRRGDPMRLACALTGFVMVGHMLRWLVVPDSQLTFVALYILGAVLAVYIIVLGRAYGRGPHV